MKAIDYLLSHRQGPPDDAGIPVFADDFGAGAPPGGNVDTAAIQERARAIRESVAYVQGLRPTSNMSKAAILERVAQVWDTEIGPFDDLAREIGELAGKA